MEELPKNWTWTKVGNLSNLLRGVNYQKNQAELLPSDDNCLVLRGGNIQDGKIVVGSDVVYVPKELVDKEQFLKAGDIIIVGSTGSKNLIGKAGLSYANEEKVSFGAFLMLIRSNDTVDKKFFGYFFLTDQYRNSIRESSGGININNIRREHILSLAFPLPPLPEQRRIVAKLDTLFAHLDQLKSRLDKIPVLLKQFRQAVLTQAVTGKLTEANRRSWQKIPLEDVCNKITDGEHITPPLSRAGIPLLSAKDVRDGFIDFTECKYVSNEFAKRSWQRCNPQPGDVVVVSRGATVGRSSLINTNKNFCLMGSVLLFKPKAEFILSQYLDIFFKSPFGLIEIVNMSGATAQQAVYIRDMKRMSIPLPEIEEQREIVRKVESLFAFADKIQLSHQSLRARINRLPQIVLSRAFQGELAKPTFIGYSREQ